DSRADAALAHATEGLTQHDRPSCGAVDVQVSGANAGSPELLLAVVEAFEAGGEAVAGGVYKIDRGIEIAGFHHAEHRAEEFGAVSETARLDAPFHAGADEIGIVVDMQARHDGPLLTGFEFLEARFEDTGRLTDQRADFGLQFPRGTDAEAFDCVAERG